MPTLQPTRSDMWVRSTNTTESAFQLWYQWIDTVSTHWVIVAGFGTLGGDGFIIRQAAGDVTSRYLFRRVSTNNLEVMIDPAGTVSLLDGSDASVYASPFRTVSSIGTAASANEWQFHEWDDYLSIYNVDRSSAICDMPMTIQVGYGITPGLLTDPASGLTGMCLLGGSTSGSNGSGNFLTISTSSPSLVRVANNGNADDWVENYGHYSGSGIAHIGDVNNAHIISDRRQPTIAIAAIKPNGRKIGIYKYLYTFGAANQTPGNVLISGGIARFQYIWSVHSYNSSLVVPIQNNFDPAAGPTNV